MSEDTRDPFKVACGERLKQTRLALGFTRMRRLAEITGESEDTLGSWERGRTLVPPPFVQKLRNLYGVTADWVYYGDPRGLPHDLALKLLDTNENAE